MSTIQDADNLKRKLAELESCFQDFPDIKRIPPMSHDESMDCLSKLKTMAHKLIKTHNLLKGYDGRAAVWNDDMTLKLTGFIRGFHPKSCNIKSFFMRDDIKIIDDALILDREFGQDYILVRFACPEDVEKALRIDNLRFPASCSEGIYLFNAILSRMRE